MDRWISRSAEGQALLRSLARGPVCGITTLIDHATSAMALGPRSQALSQRCALALKALVDRGLVATVQEHGTLRLSLTCAGRLAVRCSVSQEPRYRTANRALAAGIVALAAGGCVSSSQPAAHRSPWLSYPMPVGVQQVRAVDGTPPYFAHCNPCAPPSPKTPHVTWASVTHATVRAAEGHQRMLEGGHESGAPADQGQAPQRALVLMGPVLFASGEARLDRDAHRLLAAVATATGRTDIIALRGGADSTGSPARNEALAQKRAAAVQAELERLGVRSTRVDVSHCSTCFVASNDNAHGRSQNRRVDVEVSNSALDTVAKTVP